MHILAVKVGIFNGCIVIIIQIIKLFFVFNVKITNSPVRSDHRMDFHIQRLIILIYKEINQQWNIFFPLAQGRNMHDEYVQCGSVLGVWV